MLRFSHRFAAASIAAVLLLAPVTVQAAPADRTAAPGWGTVLLAGLDDAVHQTWRALAGVRASETDPSTDEPEVTLDPTGSDSTTATTDDGGGGETEPGWDPNG